MKRCPKGHELKPDIITGWVDITDCVVKGCYSRQH